MRGQRLLAAVALSACVGTVGGAAGAWVIYQRLGPSERVVTQPIAPGGSGGGPTLHGIAAERAAIVVTVLTQPASPSSLAAGAQGFANGFLASADGLVVTSARAVSGATRLRVGVGDGRAYDAVVVLTDPTSGAVLLRLSGAHDLPAAILSRRAPQPGDFSLVVARPPLEALSVTTGTIASTGRDVDVSVAGASVRVQALVVAAPGDPSEEGAPLLDDRGEVIGLVTTPPSGRSPAAETVALPVRAVSALIDRVGRSGSTAPPALGIDAVPLDPATAAAAGLPAGALVRSVADGGPAARAGLAAGDVVTAVNGTPVDADHPLEATAAVLEVGQRVTLTVVSRGASRNVALTATTG